MSAAECERKIALLRASWTALDDVAERASPGLRKGPRGGGCDRDQTIRHVNGAEIDEFAPEVAVVVPVEASGHADRPTPRARGHWGRVHTGVVAPTAAGDA